MDNNGQRHGLKSMKLPLPAYEENNKYINKVKGNNKISAFQFEGLKRL